MGHFKKYWQKWLKNLFATIFGPDGETCSKDSLHGTLLKELNETNQMAGLTFLCALWFSRNHFAFFTYRPQLLKVNPFLYNRNDFSHKRWE